MSVSLTKGQKVDLTKGNAGLSRIMVGLGWDEVEQKGGFFGKKPEEIDCDASALLLDAGSKLSRDSETVVLQGNGGPVQINVLSDVVFYNHLRHSSGAVVHQGDNLTGGGDGDDEQILVDLTAVPQKYDRIVFVVTIYQARERKQHFGLVKNCFIRLVDAGSNTELCRYDLSDNYNGMTAMIFGEVYRKDGEWKFNAIGQPTMDNSISEMWGRYQ